MQRRVGTFVIHNHDGLPCRPQKIAENPGLNAEELRGDTIPDFFQKAPFLQGEGKGKGLLQCQDVEYDQSSRNLDLGLPIVLSPDPPVLRWRLVPSLLFRNAQLFVVPVPD